MIFDVLRVKRQHVELLQEADHLRTAEIAKRVAGQPQTNSRSFVCRCAFRGHCEDFLRSSERRGDQCTRANEIAARKKVFRLHLIARKALPQFRHAAPSPSRTRGPTWS